MADFPNTSVHVGDFVYSLGEHKRHVEETARAGLLYSDPADLRYAGFTWHHVCDDATTSYDLAKSAVQQLAQRDRLGEIDAIVYATCLPLNANAGPTERWCDTRDVKYLMDFPAGRLQSEFNLDDAIVIGLGQQACTSMLGSVRTAAAFLAVEPSWRNILCVSADRFPARSAYEQAYNLISDGAAACVVGRAPSGFRFITCHQITNGGLGQADDDETIGSYFAFTRRLILETLARAELTVDDLDWILPQNTNVHAWRALARMLGADFDKVWAPTIGDVGHVISADNVVNLTELIAAGRIRPGDRLALVMAGFGLNFQCMILEAA